ncbi:hypothetical protein CKF54_00315 [Psittacicella hinzii]|uniref:Uncharacterized protein n=1 Tax=Psittacicella hinzii TaxID=2028575 RepID=A0A3A1Y852_9GAMM|nr:hypothetical protein [Psittacicella hinzii]RIY34473.1 hypothetical protein CKF54_00315 [Psittacicella hinzii]
MLELDLKEVKSRHIKELKRTLVMMQYASLFFNDDQLADFYRDFLLQKFEPRDGTCCFKVKDFCNLFFMRKFLEQVNPEETDSYNYNLKTTSELFDLAFATEPLWTSLSFKSFYDWVVEVSTSEEFRERNLELNVHNFFEGSEEFLEITEISVEDLCL